MLENCDIKSKKALERLALIRKPVKMIKLFSEEKCLQNISHFSIVD